MSLCYLDNAATTPIDPEVRDAMLPLLGETFGNPSSRHGVGLEAARKVELARDQVARACGARAEDVFLTSGGTEANNLAVLGLARARRKLVRGSGSQGAPQVPPPHILPPHVLIGATEHPCVHDPAQVLAAEGFDVETIALNERAQPDLDDLVARLRPQTVLVAHMCVNNEFGSVYPIARLARAVRANAPQALVHTDAVQALGKIEVSLAGLGVDSLAVSAHKIHGPKGAGALVLRPGLRPQPLVHGGGQEQGIRSGTENVIGAVGLGAAAHRAEADRTATMEHMRSLRGQLLSRLEALAGARPLIPTPDEVSPAIVAVLLPGPPAEVWMHHLEERGIQTSVGSACHAKTSTLSPALLALGLSENEAKQVLRVSFSGHTRADEVERLVTTLFELEPSLVRTAS